MSQVPGSPASFFSASRALCWTALCLLLTQDLRADVFPALTAQAESLAVVETAAYQAQLTGEDLTAGEMTLDVVRRGPGSCALDWTDARLAISELRWPDGPAISGTTAAQRLVVLIERGADRLRGNWSAHGEKIGQAVVFDLVFPPALNARLQVQAPAEIMLESNQGSLQSSEPDARTGQRLWTLELGRVPAVTLRAGPASQLVRPTRPRYEAESIHVARQDGIFLQTDLLVDWPAPRSGALFIEASDPFDIQSITASGATLPHQPTPARPRTLSIPASALPAESRFSIRVRGFEAARWGQRRVLPRLRIVDGLETRRTVALRVEPPLQLMSVDAPGMVQTALSSAEATGELWKFEAREPDSRAFVEIDHPRARISADVLCLADARPGAAWSAAQLAFRAENGSRYEVEIQLLEDWKLSSVAAGDAESRIASWNLRQQTLSVAFQNPMTRTAVRHLRLFFRTPALKPRAALKLPWPLVKQAEDVSLHYQLVLPADRELQLQEGEGWRGAEAGDLHPSWLQFREAAERLADPARLNVAALRSPGEPRGRLVVTLVPRAAGGEVPEPPSAPDATPAGAAAHLLAPLINETPVAARIVTPPDGLAVQMQTTLGDVAQLECVHHLTLTFDRPVDLPGLNLRLPSSCRVSTVSADQRPVRVLREGDAVKFPADAQSASVLHLTYVTAGAQDWLTTQHDIPVPQTGIPVVSFLWTLDLPAEQRIASLGLPGLLTGAESEPYFLRRLFGPLGRAAEMSAFNPFSPGDWRSLAQSPGAAQRGAPARRSLTFLAPTAGASVQLTSWDALRVRSLASVALLGCLLVGSAVRLYRISWLKQLTIVWLTTLALLIWGAPAPWAVICGGMLSGSLLSVLVPRRWMEKRDFLARAPARLQAAAAALAVLNIGAGSGVRAEPLSPSPPGLPDVLISAARYELGEAGAVPHLKATFTVLLQPAHAEQFLRLPFQDVVFDAQAECLLDGVRQPLLPAIGGDAVLVRLPSTDFTATATQWQRHALQIDFLIRPQTADAAQATWRAGIPAVLDSTLIVPPGQTAPPLVRRGAIVPGAEGRQVLSLGGLGRLATEPNGTSPPADATAVSLLDVSPLRISGSTRIVLDPASRSARLSLAFPPDCLINSVTGASVLDWIELPSVAEQPAFLVRLRTDAPPAPISISFDLPGQNVQGPDVNLPAFRLWGGPAVSHAIGLSGPPAAAFALANSSGIATLTPEEWQAVSEPGRPRPPLAIQLKSPQAVALQWSWLTPQRTSAISETVSVRRDGLDWSAAVRVTVAQAAAFKHQFRLDARVRVDGVTDGENGQESPLRFVRTGDLLTVFLPGGQLGEKILTMTGRTPLSPDAWSPLPALEPLESAVSESQLTIRDETGWDLEMETAGGAKLQAAAPDVASPAAPRGGSRVASIFRKGTARPVKLRASPPAHAIRSESALLLQTPEKGDWELSASFWLSSADAPLRTASFLLPRELANVRVRPGTLKAALTPDELGTRVTVGIPERSAGGVALTLSARISPELKARLLSAGGSEASAALPVPVCTSAQRGVQWVLIRPDSPLTVSPAAAVQAAAATLPPGVPAEWQRALADKSLNCFQQTRPDLSVSLKASPAASGRPRVRLNETCLWPLANGELRGLTRLSLVVQGADSLRLSHPEDAHVDLVCAADEGPLAWKAVRGGTQIQLPQGAEAVICEVHWRRPEARGMLRLLEVDAEKPDQRLAVVIQPADWLLDRGSAAVVTELDGWLVRWQALLGCLTDVQKPLPSDGALLRRLRLCQAQVERLLAVGGERVDAEHRGRAAQLAAEWSRRTDQLALSGAGPTAAPFAAAELDAFDQLSAGLSVVWLAPEGRNWTGRSAAPVAQHQQERMIWSAALVLASLIGAWLLSRQLNWTREFLAQRPTLGLTLLGLFWWAFLTPSPLGLAIIAGAWLGWAAAALARLAGRWLPALSGS